jgi:iron complex outermembrane receptor protein
MKKYPKYTTHLFIFHTLAGLMLAPLYAQAQHTLEPHHLGHQLEEIFITGEMLRSATETALPVTILSGEQLRQAMAGSLGQTLQNELGVNSASFGTGVGLPIIRGQSGPRVRVMQNGVSSMDAASASQDHANSIDPLVAERIEIIRGPATLLYGNGAIGGVVNVIDNRIPEVLSPATTGAVELRRNSVSSEDSGAFKLENSISNIAWHLDGAWRDSGLTRIPEHAVDEAALHSTHDEAEEPHIEPEGIASEESAGTHEIDNSNSRSHSLAAGGSWIGASGFAGFSVSHLENDYGLPPGSHLHEEDQHVEEEPAAEEPHEEGDTRIHLEQTRYTVKGRLETRGFYSRLNARLAYSDYEHTEFHKPDEHLDEPSQSAAEGARFTNRGFEARLSAHHDDDRLAREGLWSGVVGLQLSDNEFAVEGDEGFIPRTDIQSMGIFALETITSGRWIYELGARLEQVEYTPEGSCNREDTSMSASIAGIWQMSDSVNTSLSISRAQRSAGVEERYSNINIADCNLAAPADWKEHSPTGLIELGNPNLTEETSNNIEFSLHKHLGEIHGEISIYLNRVDDYIYLAETQDQEERATARYQQHPAEFYGYEAEITLPIKLSVSRQMEITLFSDAVHAELTTGEYLPRIPTGRIGFLLKLQESDWSTSLRTTRVDRGDNLAPGEAPTAGYTLVDLNADYHFDWGNNDVLIFAQGFNLLNQTIRNHTSFTKSLAPEPGRGVKAGVRLSF